MALAAAFIISAIATPAGISGAVLLLPFQVSVLGTPSPAVTPTNLLYNVVSTPGALYRYQRQHQTGGRLALILITGTLPGVIAGSVVRVELVPGPRVFDLMVTALLLPLGIWLAATRPARNHDSNQSVRPARHIPALVLIGLATVTGCVGGIYGIGGGAILSPILIGSGRPAAEVAPAALASTFVTSLGGVLTFHPLVHQPRPGRAELAHWHRAGHRRHRRRLPRSPDAVPAPRHPDPPHRWRPRCRHRRPVPAERAELSTRGSQVKMIWPPAAMA